MNLPASAVALQRLESNVMRNVWEVELCLVYATPTLSLYMTCKTTQDSAERIKAGYEPCVATSTCHYVPWLCIHTDSHRASEAKDACWTPIHHTRGADDRSDM